LQTALTDCLLTTVVAAVLVALPVHAARSIGAEQHCSFLLLFFESSKSQHCPTTMLSTTMMTMYAMQCVMTVTSISIDDVDVSHIESSLNAEQTKLMSASAPVEAQKAIVKSADMPEELQANAIEVARTALRTFETERDIAKHIKVRVSCNFPHRLTTK
jgi:hypothetical protein